jgi:hypothetical protein
VGCNNLAISTIACSGYRCLNWLLIYRFYGTLATLNEEQRADYGACVTMCQLESWPEVKLMAATTSSYIEAGLVERVIIYHPMLALAVWLDECVNCCWACRIEPPHTSQFGDEDI